MPNFGAHQSVPFRPDSLTKSLKISFGEVNLLPTTYRIYEILGLSSQIGTTNKNYLRGVEAPAIFIYNDVPIVFGVKNNRVVISHPNKGIEISLSRNFAMIFL